MTRWLRAWPGICPRIWGLWLWLFYWGLSFCTTDTPSSFGSVGHMAHETQYLEPQLELAAHSELRFFESSEKWNKNLDSSAFRIQGNCKDYASALVSGFSNSSELFDQPNILRCVVHQSAFYLRETCQHIPDKWNFKKVHQCGVCLSLWRFSSHSLPWTCLTGVFKVLTSSCSPVPFSTMSSV